MLAKQTISGVLISLTINSFIKKKNKGKHGMNITWERIKFSNVSLKDSKTQI